MQRYLFRIHWEERPGLTGLSVDDRRLLALKLRQRVTLSLTRRIDEGLVFDSDIVFTSDTRPDNLMRANREEESDLVITLSGPRHRVLVDQSDGIADELIECLETALSEHPCIQEWVLLIRWEDDVQYRHMPTESTRFDSAINSS